MITFVNAEEAIEVLEDARGQLKYTNRIDVDDELKKRIIDEALCFCLNALHD